LTTAQVSERAGGYVVLSLYRHEVDQPFGEPERAWIERVVPHVVDCLQQCHLAELQRATKAPSSAITRSAAIVNRKGIILDAEPAFIELLVRHHPRWRGPFLPKTLASITRAATRETHQVAGKLALLVHPSGDLALLRVRPVLPIDALSKREREVADLFAAGDTTRQIGARLGIAANTVRVHVSRVYDKLGVVNKAELASMLAGAD
jgi:DNA-binding CsgD family transcriptional regulator